MKSYFIYIIIYYILITLYAIGLTVIDKSHALKRKRRIPENALLWIGVLGGAGGMYLAMKVLHHKTRVKKFMAFLPALTIVHLIVIIALFVLSIR
ncbi:MAG: DUF1294 domain-containing protein [Ruminococcaceae bacterium]|nr:DUF1294 domain-containing protein [Oscillospiraceae bacterium]